MRKLFTRFIESFPFLGLLFGGLAFCASLTPSLLPRTALYQGLLSGVALACGYGVGIFRLWLWEFLELPKPSSSIERIAKLATFAFLLVLAAFVLWRATDWQNSIRELMALDPLASARPFQVLGIALLSAFGIIMICKLLRVAMIWVARQANRILPRRISIALGALTITLLFGLLVSGVLARSALNAADASFRELDKVVDHGVEQPTDPLVSGSPASLVSWESIGAQGKRFLTRGPSPKDIEGFRDGPAMKPIRVYVGLRSAPSSHERAELALKDLIRTGAFDRSVLIVATPTGTGWMDPAAVNMLEYLHGGDSAIVATQYSYLPSWQTLIVDPDRSRESARALFDVIYPYWTSLPKDSRPRLYLFGLSLGALGSETSSELYLTFEDPINGALWAGPPFLSRVWPDITRSRNPDSPYWRPIFKDSRLFRFTNQTNSLSLDGAPWGPIRLVYLQHASDPMIFFSTDLLWEEPDWLNAPRGPDVSPKMRWFPLVTFLQLAFDVPMATSVPVGYGHSYSAVNYIDAWMAVTQPEGWSQDQIDRLKDAFREDGLPTE